MQRLTRERLPHFQFGHTKKEKIKKEENPKKNIEKNQKKSKKQNKRKKKKKESDRCCKTNQVGTQVGGDDQKDGNYIDAVANTREVTSFLV